MKMTLIILILFSSPSKAQDISHSQCDSSQVRFDKNIRVSVEGRDSDSAIERNFFRKHSRLTSSGKQVKVLGFHISWSVPLNNIVVARVNQGAVVYPDLEVN